MGTPVARGTELRIFLRYPPRLCQVRSGNACDIDEKRLLLSTWGTAVSRETVRVAYCRHARDCGAVLEGIGESGPPWVPDLTEEVRGETAEGGSPPNRTSGAASFLWKHGVRYVRATEQDIPRPPETTEGRRISCSVLVAPLRGVHRPGWVSATVAAMLPSGFGRWLAMRQSLFAPVIRG